MVFRFRPQVVSLARSTLTREFGRYIPSILAVSFASLLLLMQIALVVGLFRLVTSVVDQSHADIWLTSPRLESFDQAVDIPAYCELVLKGRPEVAQTERIQMVNADVRRNDGTKIAATVIGYDLRKDSFVMPQSFRPELADALRVPGGIIIDAADAPKLRSKVGTILEVNGQRAPVVGITHHFRGVGGVYIITSIASAKMFGKMGIAVPEMTTFVAAKLRDPTHASEIRDYLQSKKVDRAFDAWTSRELSQQTQRYWVLETGMGAGVLFSAVVGVVVGIVITGQTLRSVIYGSLKQFATLRAMGVPVSALRMIVLELASWIGALGLVCTGLVAFAVAGLGEFANVSLAFPWWSISATVFFTFMVAWVSGFVALRVLYSAEPAELLR